MKVTLTIDSGGVEQRRALADEPITIGRGEDCDIPLPADRGLSRRHAKLCLRDGRVWAYDEGSTNGLHLNGKKVTKERVELSDGDELQMGNSTRIAVAVKRDAARGSRQPSTSAPLSIRLAALFVVAVVLCGTGFLLYGIPRERDPLTDSNNESPDTNTEVIRNNLKDTPTPPPATPAVTPTLTPTPSPTPDPTPPPRDTPTPDPGPGAKGPILYKDMGDKKAEFIRQRTDHVARMMAGRPYNITPEALKRIQYWLDSFANRVGSRSANFWGSDTVRILERGKGHAPVIIRTFREYNVPIVIGLYIPFIETQYVNIPSDNGSGAAGLFQFLGPTARLYGVQPAERTNVPKMADAAARYFRDNIASFGSGPMGTALSIAGYNRAAESVKRDLRNVLNTQNNEDKERSFWTLVANESRLDNGFRTQNIDYVPRFFAAAIFGETPWAFGIDMCPLSAYSDAAGCNNAAAPPSSPNH